MIGADVVGFNALIQDPDPAAVTATKARLLVGLLACPEQRPARRAFRRLRHPQMRAHVGICLRLSNSPPRGQGGAPVGCRAGCSRAVRSVRTVQKIST